MCRQSMEYTIPLTFLRESTAGWFKGINPSYPWVELAPNWVKNVGIVYIGKAGGSRGLRQRIKQLIDFAYGKPIGHRGGRMLWHLSDWTDLTIQWWICEPGAADALESQLIDKFRSVHGMRPFANMNKQITIHSARQVKDSHAIFRRRLDCQSTAELPHWRHSQFPELAKESGKFRMKLGLGTRCSSSFATPFLQLSTRQPST